MISSGESIGNRGDSTGAPAGEKAREGHLLEVRDLRTRFFTPEGVVKAVDGVSFGVGPNEIIGLVGESGCGKSVTALSILGLVPDPPGRITGGEVIFDGDDLTKAGPRRLREIRGNRISMIPQEPMTSLNPVFTLGDQLAEVYTEHYGLSRKEALARAAEMLDRMRVPSPLNRIHEYPHHISGGMRQRVMIAMALSCDPELILADEPTTALDVTTQAQIIEEMVQLRRTAGTSIILVTHNLGLVAESADRVIVMYAGKIAEEAPVAPLFQEPFHPYTVGLLNSIPRLGSKTGPVRERLFEIPGLVPSPGDLPSGCSFHPRCGRRRDICAESNPELTEIRLGRKAACWAVIEGW
jgi:peptide/nickel transport system ATP-binding protein/oligopeptide transport system ATP-binding protein